MNNEEAIYDSFS